MKININHTTSNYVERGLPQGIPIVFIHGFPFSHEMWEPQMRVLPNSYRAIAYDVRGHGKSEVGDGQYTIELFVDDLIALLDHLVIDKAILCGLSMGGYIALRAVERHPSRVAGLLLCDTKSEPDTNEAKIGRTTTLKQLKSAGLNVFAEDFLKRIFWDKSFERNPQAIELIRKIILANSPLAIGGALLALASRTDTTSALESISIPTSLIVGNYDKLTPPAVMQSMQTKIGGSELKILPDAGHMSNLENTKEFNETMLEFLKRHWKTE
jgi:3-oxoadipate enol-lactonase